MSHMIDRLIPSLVVAGAAALLCVPLPGVAAPGVVNLYTTREPGLMQPLLEAFSTQSGIKVNTVYIKDGLIERVKAEGAQSPADVLMTVDIGNLIDLVEREATQPVDSPALTAAIPAHLRGSDGKWFALSLRDRVLYAEPDLKLTSFTYEELAEPKWKGKVCIRAGQHPYNIALIASMIAHQGRPATEQWLRGLKANLARKAAGGDRDVARDILGGICDIGIANAYYAGQMKSAKPGTDARKWGDAIAVVRPTFAKTGATFVNISGAGVAANAPNKANAIKLLEYLASEAGQALYANADFEYPVRVGVPVSALMQSFGPLVVDTTPLVEIAKFRKEASLMVDQVGFDR